MSELKKTVTKTIRQISTQHILKEVKDAIVTSHGFVRESYTKPYYKEAKQLYDELENAAQKFLAFVDGKTKNGSVILKEILNYDAETC
ncbi:hypothetical protein KAR91_82495, partial [Candidatus Pacearchaeota archaeon]|nr:hypothetical protein [Candidatus Pacearchaeota archaeon]